MPRPTRATICHLLLASCLPLFLPGLFPAECLSAEPADVSFARVQQILKNQCVKCHGPLGPEGSLDLSTPAAILNGGDSGAAVSRGNLEDSPLWQRVAAHEMPPEAPLDEESRQVLQAWIETGAPGLPEKVTPEDLIHWSFRSLQATDQLIPSAAEASNVAAENPIDHFLLPGLKSSGLDFSPQADSATLLRRVSLMLTGIPPTLDEQERFLNNSDADVYDQIVEYYLASPHYGERWGKFWLDAAGYADSNGYFNADTPRPLAWKYRDYVVDAFNDDKPFDQFIREQIAGDELSGYRPDAEVTPEMIEQLTATHYLRNAQDGTDSSDGNPDELRTDRYSAIEGTMQNVSTSLLGLTIQCARCHSHKFEPISQEEYYQFQSFFYPAFNVEKWQKPATRIVEAALPAELAVWETEKNEREMRLATLEEDLRTWSRENRPQGEMLFEDDFTTSNLDLKLRWSDTAPGDDVPGSSLPIKIGEPSEVPAFYSNDAGHLVIDASQAAGQDSWNSTQQMFEWAPAEIGEWIQVSFDLVDNRLNSESPAALRIGYGIALHDYNDNSSISGGNVVFEGGVPGGGAAMYYDLPGGDSVPMDRIGDREYAPGHNYGVRLTRTGEDKVELQHLVDGVPEGRTQHLKPNQLPAGGFGFVYYQGRSFIVDNVRIERTPLYSDDFDIAWKAYHEEDQKRRDEIDTLRQELTDHLTTKPGRIAWVADYSGDAPDVPLLVRGGHSDPGELVEPAPFSILCDSDENGELPEFKITPPHADSTGRRTAWANWVTRENSRPAALMARVQMNRLWQHYFGTGIVSTPDNLGYSGDRPTHPGLLEFLASYFVEHGWSRKDVHRLVLHSRLFKQSSQHNEDAYTVDPDNKLYWKFPRQRLNAEGVRDAMLYVAGSLDTATGGPSVMTSRDDAGVTVVDETTPGAHRRSLYLYQRRTQIPDMLQVFDAPKIVFNCTRRNVSTTPLQSLSLMNSDFIRRRAAELAARLDDDNSTTEQVEQVFQIVYARRPSADETTLLSGFLEQQKSFYEEEANPARHAWIDCCQMLLASSEFLYIQ